MIEIELIVIIRFHILSLPINRHQVHIQQRSTAIQMQSARRDAILRQVGSLSILKARGSDEEKRVLDAHTLVNFLEQVRQSLIQPHVSVLNLRGRIIERLSIEGASIVAKRKKVRHIIASHSRLRDDKGSRFSDEIIDESRSLETAKTSLTRESMVERRSLLTCQVIVIARDSSILRLPRHLVNARYRPRSQVLIPRRLLSIIARASPFASVSI